MKKNIFVGLLIVLLGITAYTTGYIIMVNSTETYTPKLHAHTIVKESSTEEENFIIRSENGVLVVYDDKGLIFDKTNIRLSELPKELQIKVLNGYMVKTLKELYRLLETYST